MRQTAVDWLVKEFNLEHFEATVRFAKEMEKQQHFETWDNGMDEILSMDENDPRLYKDFEQDYNERFGGKK